MATTSADAAPAPVTTETGVVKFFNTNKGYGFIVPDEGGRDVFVHISDIQKSRCEPLADGDRVSFQPMADLKGKGTKAANIRKLNVPSTSPWLKPGASSARIR